MEVMVTVVILAAGLVGIYRSFFIGSDIVDHLANRLCALNLLETKIAAIEKDFRSPTEFDIGPLTAEAEVNNRTMIYTYKVDLKPVGNLLSVFRLDISISWMEKGVEKTLSNSAYFAAISSAAEGES